MLTDREKNLKSIVNASGFVFQLSVMDNVQRTKDSHGWGVLAHEHPWRNNVNGDEGYIDLVLKKNRNRLIIECKRRQDASWVFLNPDTRHDEVDLARFLWADIKITPHTWILTNGIKPGGPAYDIISGSYDFAMVPASPESEFCVIRGSGENDKPLLERICGQLLRAIDCLSVEEMIINKTKEIHDASVYIPAIITNAKLELCTFDPGKVSLSDGILKEGKFRTLPFIRFRKSLTTGLTSQASPSNIADANKDKERTILIINADFFCEMLENMQVKLPPFTEPWPWFCRR